MKSMAVCFLLMSIFSIPSMIISYQSSKIGLADRDVFGLYQLTLGNLGYNTLDPSSKTASTCTKLSSTVTANTTCLTVLGQEITLNTAGNTITAFEFIQVCIFFAVVISFSRFATQLESQAESGDTAVSDYAIVVRDIPPDTN